MNIKKVLIVYKKSAYETYFKKYRAKHLKGLLKENDNGLLHIRHAHDTHYDSLVAIEKILKKSGIQFQHVYRGKSFNENAFDLVLSLGGDGTFLDAARFTRKKMILGVNSDTRHSVGRFCSTDSKHFEKALQSLLDGRFRVEAVRRMKLKLNGAVYRHPVLNDILVSHACPAGMSHYAVELAGQAEQQRSSGVWVSTAAGSTAGSKSAGGKVYPIDSALLQYRPRELYPAHGVSYQMTGGQIKPSQKIVFISKMQEGMIFLDGAHENLSFRYGDRLEVSSDPSPIKIIFLN